MFSVKAWCEYIQGLPSSEAFRYSQYVYPATLTSHLLGMCLLLGLVFMMDLRLMGIGNMGTSLSQIQKRLFPWQMAGMVLSFATGFVLFWGEPLRFYANLFFWMKVVLMVLAGVNALAFHMTTYHSVAKWDNDPVPPFAAKVAGVLSIVLWAGVVYSGRLIAYNWFQTYK